MHALDFTRGSVKKAVPRDKSSPLESVIRQAGSTVNVLGKAVRQK
jgi:hypothetical protein